MIVIDRTHMGRRASGIERITEELFSPAMLAPLPVTSAGCTPSLARLLFKQTFALPARALLEPGSVWVFPGYPPSPAFAFLRERVVVYVHDLFLMTRPQDLNTYARVYASRPFALAVKTFKYFLTNSLTTQAALKAVASADAKILPYRPEVRNVFGLTYRSRDAPLPDQPLIVGCIGTIEPRKNYTAAARICAALGEVLKRPVELHIIGRQGWGSDYALLTGMENVRLYGFLPDEAASPIIQGFDLLLSTSHDEGLGLPLLEVQYGGIAVAAPDRPVFREVLREGGIFIEPADAPGAACVIADALALKASQEDIAAKARANISAWNAAARQDRHGVIALLANLLERAREKQHGRVV